MEAKNLQEAVNGFILKNKSYYKQWTFDEPLIISKNHHSELESLQTIMYKLIQEFVTNYNLYKGIMPISEKSAEIIDIFNQKDYKIGTYRTDFVYDSENQVKIIEITCRFALNGLFLSAITNDFSEEYQSRYFKDLKIINSYNSIYEHLYSYLTNVNSITVLKGDDVRNESKIYKEIFEKIGFPVLEINYQEIESNLDKLEDSLVISELSLEEICSLDINLIKKMASLEIINDFRTVFLIHDKRFFSVIGDSALQKASLTKEEIKLFKKFYIPTYLSTERLDLWEKAKMNKDNWIIKHRSLGKSQMIYAGIVTEQKEWEDLFEHEQIQDFILQEWIPQKTIKGKIGNKEFMDYVTGTLLFFDDNYFGLGLFRTSSFPVSNKVDDRKATSLVLADDTQKDLYTFTNYIQ